MRTLAIVLALLWAVYCPAEDWEQIPDQSRLGFVGTLEGEAFEGVFHRFSAVIRFDPKALEKARFEVEIDVASADTKNRERDQALKQEEWFHTAQFPRASYRAEKFRSLGEDRFVADGTLTIKGVSRRFSLPFSWRNDRDHAKLSARVSLRRTDFNIGEGEWADDERIGRTVQVRADLRLRRVN
jgi:polyisoprenoid-binding protein YceI